MGIFDLFKVKKWINALSKSYDRCTHEFAVAFLYTFGYLVRLLLTRTPEKTENDFINGDDNVTEYIFNEMTSEDKSVRGKYMKNKAKSVNLVTTLLTWCEPRGGRGR